MTTSKGSIGPGESVNRIAVFQEKAIRRAWHNNEWWFAVTDVVEILAESANPAAYLQKIRLRDKELAQGWRQIVTPLRIDTEGGIQRVNCANTEGLFRIIQSIPSPRAEPFKRWLAEVGYERVKEIENPELASARARDLYLAKGYPQAWIEKRLRSIAIRSELTDEWRERGVNEGKEYAILTAEIARATFGLTPGAHRRVKSLDKVKTGNNLRDHMTDLELIFTMLGEAGTTEIARHKDARGFNPNRVAAKQGGAVAGNARRELEARSGKPVVSRSNYLPLLAAGSAGVLKSSAGSVAGAARPAPKKTKKSG